MIDPRTRSSSAVRPVNPVGAVTAAVAILHHLAATDAPMGATQVARSVRLNTSTVFNILRTLAQLDLVSFDDDTKTYRLGLGVVELARGALRQSGVVAAVQPRLAQLARSHEVTVGLWRLLADHLTLVASADSITVMRIHISVGQRLPAFIGATGRTVAAHSRLKPAQIRAAFDRLRWEDPMTYEQYASELDLVRERGYAIDDGDYLRGVTSVAAPVLDAAGDPVMSVGAHFFRGQKTPDQVADIAGQLSDVALLVRTLGLTTGFD